jgi:uncharacterized membrane protein YbhN (UPF0104 family)
VALTPKTFKKVQQNAEHCLAVGVRDLGLRWGHFLAGGLSLALLALAVASPQLLGDQVRRGISGLDEATPVWLWLAGGCFAASIVCVAAAWRVALRSVGSTIDLADSSARYGAGSLANSLLPAKIGTALRLALYTRSLKGEGRLWTVGGIGTAIGAAHSFWLAVLVAVAAWAGVVPLWPLAVLVGLLVAAAVAAVVARRMNSSRRIAHALDAFRELGSCPKRAAVLLGWTGLAMAIRVPAAAAVLAAFGVDRPLAAAFLVVPAVELAAVLPLTPGNIGVAGAAVAFALKSHGVDGELAITVGIAFNAIETLTSIVFGTGSALYLVGAESSSRRWATAVAGASACACLAGAFSWTVLVPLS